MKKIFSVAALAALFCACSTVNEPVGQRVDALPDDAWEASEWISVADAPVVMGEVHSKENCRAADGASWFVSTFENEKPVLKAVWMTTGLGVYDIFINGKLIGEEVLKPGFTHFGKTKLSFPYDITDAFKAGSGAKNTLSAQVTPGWWADKIITPSGFNGMRGEKCAFRGVLEVTYKDSTTVLFGTDVKNWQAGIAGPVKHADIFDGEEYDAREKQGYETPEKLSAPVVNKEFHGEIFPSDGAEVYQRWDLALKPVSAYVWKDVADSTEEQYGKVVILREFAPGLPMSVSEGETLVIDFGQNAAAVPSFEFKAAEGTELTFLGGELLNDGAGAKSRGMDGPEGSVHRLNLRSPDEAFRMVYTFGPAKGFVSYTPRYTFFGYRYASITATGDVVIRRIESIPVTSIAADLETGTIKTGDESINKLISNTLWGQRSNYLSVPTDCPQRNERLGWTADTQVFTETGTFFANTDAFFHKWMRDMRNSVSETGSFPGVAPTAQYGGSMMRLGWSDAGIIVPWTVWKQFADTAIVDENWDAMDRYFGHITETSFSHEAIREENGNYQWADWLSYEPLESCSHKAQYKDENDKWQPLPESIVYWDYLAGCYWAMDAEMMADMAAATGRDAASFIMINELAKDYLRREFLNEDGTFKLEILNTMQTPALFALRLGLVEGDALEAMKARLRANFAEHDGCLQTGFLGTSILMSTLTDNGMADIAWDLLFQRKNPSWLYSVDNGATTIWERWNSYTIESGMGPKGMNSFNHYAYGCVCQWIWETAAGINADKAQPGFKHIVLKPVPDKRLGSIEASFNSAAGLIKSSWKYSGDNWTWDFTIPEGATASVTLPGEDSAKEYEAGSYSVSKQL